jgi:hypothetical protein
MTTPKSQLGINYASKYMYSILKELRKKSKINNNSSSVENQELVNDPP